MRIFHHMANNARQFLYTLKNLNKTFYVAFNEVHNKSYTCYNRSLHTIPVNGPWKVLFFGTDEFSVESLKTLHNK